MTLTADMIDTAEANIRNDHYSGKISFDQFKKEMLIVARARKQISTNKETQSENLEADRNP